MVIRPVAQGDLLFLDFPPELAVREADPGGGERGPLLKETAHTMQEPGGTGEHGSGAAHGKGVLIP